MGGVTSTAHAQLFRCTFYFFKSSMLCTAQFSKNFNDIMQNLQYFSSYLLLQEIKLKRSCKVEKLVRDSI